MKKLILALLIGAVLFLDFPDAEAVPVRAGQPHPDLFSCGTFTCDVYNPITQTAKSTHIAKYRLEVLSGCTQGLIVQDMAKLSAILGDVQFQLVNDANAQFVVRVNCGLGQANLCGSVNTFCVGRGFPYVGDTDISDIMYTPYLWPEITRLSILCHEICGHVIASWNEQYCIGNEPVGNPCQGFPRFAPTPNWRDFMNTGELSRHLFEAIETERWERTMYLLQAPAPCGEPCWNGTRWVFSDGWQFQPNATDGQWYDPQGRLVWDAVDKSWSGRYSPVCHGWYQRGHDGSAFCDGYGWLSMAVP